MPPNSSESTPCRSGFDHRRTEVAETHFLLADLVVLPPITMSLTDRTAMGEGGETAKNVILGMSSGFSRKSTQFSLQGNFFARQPGKKPPLACHWMEGCCSAVQDTNTMCSHSSESVEGWSSSDRGRDTKGPCRSMCTAFPHFPAFHSRPVHPGHVSAESCID